MFYINDSTRISYSKLLLDINNSQSVKYCIYFNDDYKIFLEIIKSLLNDTPIILLDKDFSSSEIDKLGISESDLNKEYNVKYKNICDSTKLIELVHKINEWNITLFTSGTTGIPKKVVHDFSSITRNVKINERYKKSVWGFAYNPTHIAGLQVFFQAFFNKNCLVNIFSKNRDVIIDQIDSNEISNISATATYFRLLAPFNFTLDKVMTLTMGGEKFDSTLVGKLNKSFPNAKIRNIYASTEAGTIFTSKGKNFVINQTLKDKIKIENNELLIHESLVGKLSSNINGWYHTGDIIEVLNEDPFEFNFINRKNEMINVGGYKVNPNEVEECIRNSSSDINNVVVYGKKNSVIGTILCCDIVSDKELTNKDIQSYLLSKLQKYKIPRVINFVDKINYTRTGKIKR